MVQQGFGKRQGLADVAVMPPNGGAYVYRNRLFTQVAVLQFGVLAFAFSWALAALFHLPHDVPLGFEIIGIHVLLYCIFTYANRNVLVSDEKFVHAARTAQNGIIQHVAMASLWIPVILMALIVIGSNEETECIAGLTTAFCILLLLTLFRRAMKVAREASVVV